MQRLAERLGNLPSAAAMDSLQAADRQRRQMLKLLVTLLASGTVLATAVQQREQLMPLLADQRTGTGERRRLVLAEGTLLHLNARTAVDIDYDARQRQLTLHGGEILVETAPDTLARPFEVLTPAGRIRALGTRFSVRAGPDQTTVLVFEHAVAISPAQRDAPAVRLEAGSRLTFSASAEPAPPSPLAPGQDAWVSGRLVVLDARLDEVLASLARYRHGMLSCDPSVAGLRLSGSFLLSDTDTALDNLAASLPIRIRYLTRYWVRVTHI